MPQMMTQPEMAAHDTKIYKLMEHEAKLRQGLHTLGEKMHIAVGDKRVVKHNHRVWAMSDAEVAQAIKALAPTLCIPQIGQAVGSLTDSYERLTSELTATREKIDDLEVVWQAHDWSRWYPCRNRDGHIHSSLRGCPTVRFDTAMGWDPSLSGKTEDEAVAALDEGLCSICFPSAPVTLHNYVPKRTREERAQREAEQVARMAAKAAKTLTQAEQFRSRSGERIETVAALRQLIREPADTRHQLAWYRSDAARAAWSDAEALARATRIVTERLEGQEKDAETAARILEAREHEHTGWGADAAEIAKIRASAEKRASKEWKEK